MLINAENSSDTDVTCTDEKECLTYQQVMFYNVTLPLISITGLFVNLVVILGILTGKALRRFIANIFIVNLAFADILVLVIGVPLWVYQLSAEENYISCRITFGITISSGGISVLTLGAISLDRYYAVTMPYSYHVMMTRRRAFVAVAVLWLIGIFCSLPIFLGWKSQSHTLKPLSLKYCIYTRIFREEMLLWNLALAVFIICMNVCIYCRLLFVARYHARRINITKNNLSANQSTTVVSRERRRAKGLKATKTLGFILGVLLGCWVPFIFVAFIDIIRPQTGISVFTVKTLGTLTYINSILDPIVYTFMSRDFKRSVKRAIRRRMLLTHEAPGRSSPSTT